MGRRKKEKGSRSPEPASRLGLWKHWWAGKGPIFRFGLVFVALIALFSTIGLAPIFQKTTSAYLGLDARLASIILNGLGQQTHCVGDTIASSRFAVTVLSECSANEFVGFLWAGVLAFPVIWRKKIIGLVLGTAAVGLTNLARIVTLFFVGAFHPFFFPVVHEELWPGLFAALMILFVTVWASWATSAARRAEGLKG